MRWSVNSLYSQDEDLAMLEAEAKQKQDWTLEQTARSTAVGF